MSFDEESPETEADRERDCAPGRPWEPSPEEILEVCRAIQADWSESERRSRIADDRVRFGGWQTPRGRSTAKVDPEWER